MWAGEATGGSKLLQIVQLNSIQFPEYLTKHSSVQFEAPNWIELNYWEHCWESACAIEASGERLGQFPLMAQELTWELISSIISSVKISWIEAGIRTSSTESYGDQLELCHLRCMQNLIVGECRTITNLTLSTKWCLRGVSVAKIDHKWS
jgi:hypothetical protein